MLELRDVALRYDGPRVLEGVDLDLSAGVFASLVGPSGSGKSSLLRAITGLHRPDAGDVTLELPDTQVGFLFQDDALLPWRTVRRNVEFGPSLNGVGCSPASPRWCCVSRYWIRPNTMPTPTDPAWATPRSLPLPRSRRPINPLNPSICCSCAKTCCRKKCVAVSNLAGEVSTVVTRAYMPLLLPTASVAD
jgi:ABC-type sugar transport system ATPase subunit